MTALFAPTIQTITAITQAVTAVVTTSDDHNFSVGNQVQFFIPENYGMRQLNGLKGYILSVTTDTLTVDINTTLFNAFVVPTPPDPAIVYQIAEVAACGDANTGYQAAGNVQPEYLTIPGAYKQLNY